MAAGSETPPRSEIDLSGYFKQPRSPANGWRAVKYYRENTTPWVIRWVMKLSGGRIREEITAAYIVLAFVGLALLVAAGLVFWQGRGGGGSLERQVPINRQ